MVGFVTDMSLDSGVVSEFSNPWCPRFAFASESKQSRIEKDESIFISTDGKLTHCGRVSVS